jgi:hypothetical protein
LSGRLFTDFTFPELNLSLFVTRPYGTKLIIPPTHIYAANLTYPYQNVIVYKQRANVIEQIKTLINAEHSKIIYQSKPVKIDWLITKKLAYYAVVFIIAKGFMKQKPRA